MVPAAMRMLQARCKTALQGLDLKVLDCLDEGCASSETDETANIARGLQALKNALDDAKAWTSKTQIGFLAVLVAPSHIKDLQNQQQRRF